MRMKQLCVILLLSLPIIIYSQELKVGDFKSLPLDISARANPLIDANGDACAIIKVRTGLDSLRFSGDLEIRKMEKHEGEFWLWVSPMTKKLSILTTESGNIEFTLPLYTVGSSVYSLDLLVSLPDKVVIRESHTAEITTKPKKAQVYINGVFMGRSPVSFSSTDDNFQYEIRKKKYSTCNSSFDIKDNLNELLVQLDRDPKANRMFASLFTGGNKLGTLFYGIKVGQMGKTGWYVSFVPSLRNKNNIGTVFDLALFSLSQTDLFIDINYDKIARITGVSPEGYYFKLIDKNNTFYNHFRIKLGITQKIFKNVFLNIGLGYGSSTKYIKVLMVPYDNDPKADVPLNETLYLKSYLSDLNYLALDAGFSYRVLKHYIINLDITPLYYETFFEPKSGWRTEISLGVGYNF
jgi:hypothetical protein